jgi:hypothetical protein
MISATSLPSATTLNIQLSETTMFTASVTCEMEAPAR